MNKPRSVLATTVTEDYFTIKKMAPTSGRLFSPQERPAAERNREVLAEVVRPYVQPTK